jgi:hypothetical protein
VHANFWNYYQDYYNNDSVSNEENDKLGTNQLKDDNPAPAQVGTNAMSTTSLDSSTMVLPKIDCVVALHTCGDLSDLAMTFAQRSSCAFVICPCCYTKRYIAPFMPPYLNNQSFWKFPSTAEPSSLSSEDPTCTNKESDNSIQTMQKRLHRLAELTERPDISLRAMQLINSMRLYSLPKNRYDAYMEQLSEHSSSSRNLVLVGIPRRR